MKKIGIFLALLFFLATVGMASATTKDVIVRELCRSGETIAYGIYDAKNNTRITTIDARGYLDLTEQIKKYEQQNGVKLFWNYYTNKKTEPGSGVFDWDC
ncbi:MAG: hypothetical protein AMQ22_01723 [Candidatus Methanofastidiosum methylothiophilum]|uniref:Uncharacterized protein n=1 Tax=Candidatus Methanofastidiosum methylothiophilum TaxID=1705564 RepID=A0A150IW77_9EURY|nr:MAG: hypothetical protein AMQ22_01723 [Candidatus Methanofastidiosum methylthiophilus]